MKKLLKKLLGLLVVASSLALFSSCNNDFEKEYTIKCEAIWGGYWIEVHEYSEKDELINIQMIEYLDCNQWYTFTSHKKTEKVKIKFGSHYSTDYYWVQQVFYLGWAETIIELTKYTWISQDEP